MAESARRIKASKVGSAEGVAKLGPAQKPNRAVVRRRPNWVFVLVAAAIALGSAGIVLSFDVRENRSWFIFAAVVGIFGSVLTLGLARMFTNWRRRSGHVDTDLFFLLLNVIVVIAWLAGMFAVFQLSYEISRDVG